VVAPVIEKVSVATESVKAPIAKKSVKASVVAHYKRKTELFKDKESDKETEPVIVVDVKALVVAAVESVVEKDNPKVMSKVSDESVKASVVKESVKVPVVNKSVKASSVVADKSSSVVADKVDVVKDNINVVADKVVKENVLFVVVDKALNINVVAAEEKLAAICSERVLLENLIRKASSDYPCDGKFVELQEKYVQVFRDPISFDVDVDAGNDDNKDDDGDDDNDSDGNGDEEDVNEGDKDTNGSNPSFGFSKISLDDFPNDSGPTGIESANPTEQETIVEVNPVEECELMSTLENYTQWLDKNADLVGEVIDSITDEYLYIIFLLYNFLPIS
ncbi:hypothetical protein Tco_1513515, partial [Tanacetum coccineum]